MRQAPCRVRPKSHLIWRTPRWGPGCCHPHSADVDTEAERGRAPCPGSHTQQCGADQSDQSLDTEPWSRPARFPPETLVSLRASLMREPQEGARGLPLGPLAWAPVVGAQCPEGWLSSSLSRSQPADRALLGLPAGLGQPRSSPGSSVAGSPSAGHRGAAPSAWAAGLGVLLTGSVAFFALLLREDTVLPILVTWAPGGRASLLGEGGQAGDPGTFLRRRWGSAGRGPDSEAGVCLPESTVSPGVSPPGSVLCCFLVFISVILT